MILIAIMERSEESRSHSKESAEPDSELKAECKMLILHPQGSFHLFLVILKLYKYYLVHSIDQQIMVGSLQ